MSYSGQCQCGAIRFDLNAEPGSVALCRCRDCRRRFCGACGTGLFHRNAGILPGLVEVQLATLDAADTPAPTMHIQTAEQLPWMGHVHQVPAFERFPG